MYPIICPVLYTLIWEPLIGKLSNDTQKNIFLKKYNKYTVKLYYNTVNVSYNFF